MKTKHNTTAHLKYKSGDVVSITANYDWGSPIYHCVLTEVSLHYIGGNAIVYMDGDRKKVKGSITFKGGWYANQIKSIRRLKKQQL